MAPFSLVLPKYPVRKKGDNLYKNVRHRPIYISTKRAISHRFCWLLHQKGEHTWPIRYWSCVSRLNNGDNRSIVVHLCPSNRTLL